MSAVVSIQAKGQESHHKNYQHQNAGQLGQCFDESVFSVEIRREVLDESAVVRDQLKRRFRERRSLEVGPVTEGRFQTDDDWLVIQRQRVRSVRSVLDLHLDTFVQFVVEWIRCGLQQSQRVLRQDFGWHPDEPDCVIERVNVLTLSELGHSQTDDSFELRSVESHPLSDERVVVLHEDGDFVFVERLLDGND